MVLIEATTDGAVVVARLVNGGRGPQVTAIDDGEWTILPSDVDVPGDLLGPYMEVAPDGTVWLGWSTYHVVRKPACAELLRYSGEAWETVAPMPGRTDLHAGPIAVGPDGTLWAYMNAATAIWLD